MVSKTSYEKILNNFQNEAVNRSGVFFEVDPTLERRYPQDQWTLATSLPLSNPQGGNLHISFTFVWILDSLRGRAIGRLDRRGNLPQGLRV